MEPQLNCFVSGALSTVLRISRLAGIAPLRFLKKGNGWCINISPRMSIFGHFFITLYNVKIIVTLIYFELWQKKVVFGTSNLIRVMAFNGRVLVVSVLAAAMFYGAPSHMRCLISGLNQLQKINRSLDIYHWPSQWTKKLLALFILWGAVTLLISSYDVVLSITKFSEIIHGSQAWVMELVKMLLLHFCYCVIQLRLMQHVLIVLHIRTSFRAVNNSLRNLLRDVKQKVLLLESKRLPIVNNPYKKINNYVDSMNSRIDSDDIKQSESHHHTVRRVADAYASTCEVVKDVDHSQGLIVLMFLGFLFLYLIATSYDFIDTFISERIFSSDKTTSLLIGFMLLLWCFYHTFNLMMIIEPCHLTHMEMETTHVLMSRLMLCMDSVYDPLAVELEKFYEQLILNEVSFKAFEVIKISRSLLLDIFSGITTYLVIIFNIK